MGSKSKRHLCVGADGPTAISDLFISETREQSVTRSWSLVKKKTCSWSALLPAVSGAGLGHGSAVMLFRRQSPGGE
ncbi:hypothetical protein C2845_PM02G04860 [Panicum miliaceum]|uniref:Uncharacterized protein n=1 Tax=Panicum miliaceum TaxID=4540 RepID=A0A3L6SC72_PANMI|nr:hypothetical protein C2845_PM02G04860 [Panicum miliaceum]